MAPGRYHPPPGTGWPDNPAGGGTGMWLARQLADVVTIYTTRECTSVRLYFPYAITHRDGPF